MSTKPTEHMVSVTLGNGQVVTGTYEIRNKMVLVQSGLNQKTTQIGSSDPHVIAEMLLREMQNQK